MLPIILDGGDGSHVEWNQLDLMNNNQNEIDA